MFAWLVAVIVQYSKAASATSCIQVFNGFQGCQQSHLIICGELYALRVTAWLPPLPPLPLPPFAEQEFEKAKEKQFIGRDWQGLGSRIKAAIPYTQMQSNMSNAINFIKVHQNSTFHWGKIWPKKLKTIRKDWEPCQVLALLSSLFN